MAKALPDPITDGLDRHPAVLAWRLLSGSSSTPSAVTPLKLQKKPGHKSAVYRLHAAGRAGSNIVAKRCRHGSSLRERAVYETILPRTHLPSLDYFGHVDEPGGENTWLFIEDAGDAIYTDHEKVEFMRWLGTLHASATDAIEGAELRELGPDRYLRHIRDARHRIVSNIGRDHFTKEEVDVQRRTLALCDFLEGRWDELRLACDDIPSTLVHGDLSSKNIRVQRTSAGPGFFALDWETAGIGPPAPDLGAVSHELSVGSEVLLSAYSSVISDAWGLAQSQIVGLAHAGLVFRLAASIDWASYSLEYPPARKPIRYLKSFERRLLVALQQLGWEYL